MKRLCLLFVLLALLLFPPHLRGQGSSGTYTPSNLIATTIAKLPSAALVNNYLYFISDGTTATDCTVGGGTTPVLCISNGSAWSVYVAGSSGTLVITGANGQMAGIKSLTELTTVANGVTTQQTAIQIPADAVVFSVPVRVIVQPGGTSTFTVTASTAGTPFQKGTNISTVAGTTDPGTKNVPANMNGVAAQTITYTFNTATTNALGQIRINIFYYQSTPPTS